MTNQWPNHYKILQTVAKIIQEKKKGNSIDHFSVYANRTQEKFYPSQDIPSPQKKNKIISKKKKGSTVGKAYKSIDKNQRHTLLQKSKEMKMTLEPIGTDKQVVRVKKNTRYLQTKVDNRVKLPSLKDTTSIKNEEMDHQRAPQIYEQQQHHKFDSKEEIQKQELSLIQRQNSSISDKYNFSIELQHDDDENLQKSMTNKSMEDIKFFENKSAQYSEKDEKDIMNRSIQYEVQEGFACDFGLQIDTGALPKEITYQYVQTEKVQFNKKQQPYMLDEAIEANIQVVKQVQVQQTQTVIKKYEQLEVNTEIVSTVNRGHQFPQDNIKVLNESQTIDPSFAHLYEKRRVIADNDFYSVDKFEEKSTKYKWIGRSNINDNVDDLKRKMYLQCLVFSVYNYFGIKTPEKRLSFQKCGNVVGDKIKDACYHVMTFDNPELQYMFQFQEFNFQAQKFPMSEMITFKNSKQQIKFKNYGGLLALAYFLNDFQLFNEHNPQIGVVIVNQNVKEIHKLSSFNYQMHPETKNISFDEIVLHPSEEHVLKLFRLSQEIQLEFFSMLYRLVQQKTFDELIKTIKQIFIHQSATYQQFKYTLLSLREQKFDVSIASDFIAMLEGRVKKVQQFFKGKLYSYNKYHNLNPVIKYVTPFEAKIERKLTYKEKSISPADVMKHIRNKDNIVIIYAEDGLGKSTLLHDMKQQLSTIDKLNVVNTTNLPREQSKLKQQLFQLSKNILLIDNGQLYQAQIIDLIQKYRKSHLEISYCITTSSKSQILAIKNRFSTMVILETELQKFSIEDIKAFMMKGIKNKTFTSKKDLIDDITSKDKFVRVLSSPFYANLFCQYLSRQETQKIKIQDSQITRFSILKTHFSHLSTLHSTEMHQLSIPLKEALADLRRIAFQYFHNNFEINENIKEIIQQYSETEIIRNQLAYYQINLDSIILTNHESVFAHNQFMSFFLVEAYSYFVQKGYRSMKMSQLYENKRLMELITQKYRLQNGHHNLLDVVFSTRKFPNTDQQSSNAITLLSRMNFIFSNINFDDCIMSQADLSNGVFYQCSFRSSNIQNAIFYKTQVVTSIFDNANMSHINLFERKYEIQFTAMTTSLSMDGRRIAFGCGNYLIIVNTETGSEIKRIEAHLDVIRSVKYTKDGISLITIADDKTLRIWDTITFKSVVFKLPQKGSISYSNETQTIASVSKNSLKVWNLKSMANEAECQGHSQGITCVEFSYDGQLILTGSKDANLRLWTIKGAEKSVFKGHKDEVISAKIAPNNRVIVSSSKQKDLIMWQTQTTHKIVQKKFMSQVHSICLDNKQKYVIVTLANDNHIVVLEFMSLEIIHIMTGHSGKIMTVNFDISFKKLISLGKDRSAKIWEFDNIMEVQKRIQGTQKKIIKGPVLSLAYDKVNLKYATSHENGQINIWNSDNNELLEQIYSHSGPVRCLAYDRQGKLYSGGSDGTLRIWNLELRKEPRNIEIHSSEILQVKLSERNRMIATSSVANQLVIHDFTGIKIIMSTREEGRIYAIQFSKDEKVMAIGGAEKYVVLYDIANGNTITRAQQLGQHSDTINCIAFFGSSYLVCALKNGQVSIWNFHKLSLIKRIENISSIRSILQFQKKYICFSSQDGRIRIINMDQGKQIKSFRYSQNPNVLSTNEDETLLYVGTSGGNLLKWNLNCVKPKKKKIEFDRKAIDMDCTKIVTVQSGKTLLIKDIFYHKEQLVVLKLDSQIQGVTFDGSKIIMLLKNGKYWEYGKRQYRFDDHRTYQGQLYFLRDRFSTNFYKSGIKKMKGMSKPTMIVIQQA